MTPEAIIVHHKKLNAVILGIVPSYRAIPDTLLLHPQELSTFLISALLSTWVTS